MTPDDGGFVARVTVTNTGDPGRPRGGPGCTRRCRVRRWSGRSASWRRSSGCGCRAGESATVELRVARDDLAYYDTRVGRWVVESGEYVVEVGASSRDLRVRATVTVQGDDVQVPVTVDTPIAEALEDPVRGPGLREALGAFLGAEGDDLLKVVGSFPVGRIASFPGVDVTTEELDRLLADPQ